MIWHSVGSTKSFIWVFKEEAENDVVVPKLHWVNKQLPISRGIPEPISGRHKEKPDEMYTAHPHKKNGRIGLKFSPAKTTYSYINTI